MRSVILVALCIFFMNALAGEITISGKYSGKDIYVRNPFNPETNEFCIQQVWVNGSKVLDKPDASAVKVSLSHLPIGREVTIRISYAEDCQPEVINEEVLHMATEFRYIETLSTNNSIEWKTEGETIAGTFVVEVRKLNADNSIYWDTLRQVSAKGELGRNLYSVEPKHVGGDNYYRIKYAPLEGNIVMSDEIIYTSTKEPIYILDDAITTYLEFSESCNYEITDSYGRVITWGFSDAVYLEDLKPGEYFVKFQNRTERFVKK